MYTETHDKSVYYLLKYSDNCVGGVIDMPWIMAVSLGDADNMLI